VAPGVIVGSEVMVGSILWFPWHGTFSRGRLGHRPENHY